MTTNILFSKVIEIFRKHPEQIEAIKDDQGEAYSMAIFHPCPEIKSVSDLKDLNLTGFKVFVEEEKDRIRFKIYDIEFVSSRGSMPRWSPVTGVPFEQIIFKDDENLLEQYYTFCVEYAKWKDDKELSRLEKLTDDFVNHETQLTFDDPFQTFIIERYKAEGGQLPEDGVEAYQAEDPNILDFTRN